MNTKHSQWYPIENTLNLHGFYAVRHSDKTRVEVVRCYAGDWAIFTYRNGEMTNECRDSKLASLFSFNGAKRHSSAILRRGAQQLEGGRAEQVPFGWASTDLP
jgi:hypothetical protein